MAPLETVSPSETLECCPNCGYSLHGLPTATRCPECGYQPQTEMLVLWGWAVGTMANATTMRSSSPVGRVAYIVGILFFAINCFSWFGIIGFLLGLLPALYSLFQLGRGYSKPGLPVQLRVSP